MLTKKYLTLKEIGAPWEITGVKKIQEKSRIAFGQRVRKWLKYNAYTSQKIEEARLKGFQMAKSGTTWASQ